MAYEKINENAELVVKATNKPARKIVDKQAFIARKLETINKKDGAQQERNAVRVIDNNK